MFDWLKKTFSADRQTASNDMLRFGGAAAFRDDSATREQSYNMLCKVVLVGDSGSGKSAFLTRVTSSRFLNEHCLTIGVEFATRTVVLEGTAVKLQMWDTAGQERYRSITRSYYRGASGVFLTADVTNPDCMKNLGEWISECCKHSVNTNIPILLLATKVDGEHAVSLEFLRRYASKEGLLFAACSARTSEGVDDAVIQLASAMTGIGVSSKPNFSWDGEKRPASSRSGTTDVNLLNVNVTGLAKEVPMATGDPCMCTNCGVLLNSLSRVRQGGRGSFDCEDATLPCLRAPAIAPELEHVEEGAGHIVDDAAPEYRIWDCEFCGRRNHLDLDFDELPCDDVVDFVVRPKPDAKTASARNVVFCLDVSGSMCVTSDVRGDHHIKGGIKQREALERVKRELGVQMYDQFMPGQPRNSTMVSRLQCVQAAIEHQVEALHREEPSTKVGLITFNDEVAVLGDGSTPPITVAGDRLNNWNELVALGDTLSLDSSLSESKTGLLESMWELEERGGTALGPALLLAIAMAGKQPGSHVVLCTDGKANIGIGSLEDDKENINLMYTQLAELAKVLGVVVSIVSIIGSECKLDHIGTLATETNGNVERVNPEELVRQRGKLSCLVNKPVIAHGAMAMVILHRALQFHGEMDDEAEMENECQNRNFIIKDLGNVTSDSELPLSYGFRSRPGRDFTKYESVPFQVQLLYTRPDGTRLLRVATAQLAVTNDRQVAHTKRTGGLLAAHAVRRTAQLAKAGQLGDAIAESERAEKYLQNADQDIHDRRDLDELNEQVISIRQCVQQELQRGNAMDNLAMISEQLDSSAAVFQKASTKKNRFW